VLIGVIQPFQQPKRVVRFFNTYRELYPVSRAVLRDIATHYTHWVTAHAARWRVPMVEAPATERRDHFVDPYFRRAEADQIVVILKGRELARYLVAIGMDDRWHLEYKRRWPDQYNLYLRDREWGRMFVRICPYFRSPPASVSTSTTGSRIACGRRGSPSANVGMPFSPGAIPRGSNSSPTR
jgi:hypothetical protein